MVLVSGETQVKVSSLGKNLSKIMRVGFNLPFCILICYSSDVVVHCIA